MTRINISQPHLNVSLSHRHDNKYIHTRIGYNFYLLFLKTHNMMRWKCDKLTFNSFIDK